MRGRIRFDVQEIDYLYGNQSKDGAGCEQIECIDHGDYYNPPEYACPYDGECLGCMEGPDCRSDEAVAKLKEEDPDTYWELFFKTMRFRFHRGCLGTVLRTGRST